MARKKDASIGYLVGGKVKVVRCKRERVLSVLAGIPWMSRRIDWKGAYAKLYAKHVDMASVDQCPKCNGIGAKQRQRKVLGSLDTTYTTFERCRACHGTGVDGLPAPEAPR